MLLPYLVTKEFSLIKSGKPVLEAGVVNNREEVIFII
jgi:hypothetical protein